MKSEVLTREAARATVALQSVEMDSAWSFLVANGAADQFREMQAAMRTLLETEQLRRDGSEIVGYAWPAFEEWGAAGLLTAGAYIKGVCEQASMAGEPSLMNLCYRLLEYWLVGLAAALIEHSEVQ